MKFTKMQGIGNDYVYVNCLSEQVKDPAGTAVLVSDRHFGVGSDGLILICPSEVADFRMDMYNADGSRGEMCGNGIRCVAKYVYDYGLTQEKKITIETLGGIKTLKLFTEDGVVTRVRVDMGEPILVPGQIPVSFEGDTVIDRPITVQNKEYRVTCVSMGNPHAIVFMEEIRDLPLTEIGPSFENHELFPKRINTEFVQVVDRKHVNMRVWERGSGETLACGTGACATAVACALNGKTDRDVTIGLLGGELEIEWEETDNHVYMTGPAAIVFDGEIDMDALRANTRA